MSERRTRDERPSFFTVFSSLAALYETRRIIKEKRCLNKAFEIEILFENFLGTVPLPLINIRKENNNKALLNFELCRTAWTLATF